MSSSEKIAIAAHLHVLLRRKTGRVTDTEWLASNREYAAEIVRFARAKARDEGHQDLAAWADKLEEVMAVPEPRPLVPLVKRVADAVRDNRLRPPESRVTTPDRQGARRVNTEAEIDPESGFSESTSGGVFGNVEQHQRHKPKDPDALRYVKGLR